MKVGVLQFFSWSRRIPLTTVYERAFSVRAGIKDSTVGVGADMLWLAGRLKPAAPVFFQLGGGMTMATKHAFPNAEGSPVEPHATTPCTPPSIDRSAPTVAQGPRRQTNLTVVLAAHSGVPGRPRTPYSKQAHRHQGKKIGVTGDAQIIHPFSRPRRERDSAQRTRSSSRREACRVIRRGRRRTRRECRAPVEMRGIS